MFPLDVALHLFFFSTSHRIFSLAVALLLSLRLCFPLSLRSLVVLFSLLPQTLFCPLVRFFQRCDACLVDSCSPCFTCYLPHILLIYSFVAFNLSFSSLLDSCINSPFSRATILILRREGGPKIGPKTKATEVYLHVLNLVRRLVYTPAKESVFELFGAVYSMLAF